MRDAPLELVHCQVKPIPLLQQAVAIGGIAQIRVYHVVEEGVEAVDHESAHARVVEAEILGHQDAVFGVDQRLVALALIGHPLSEVARLFLYQGDIVVVIDRRGESGSQRAVVLEAAAWQTGCRGSLHGIHPNPGVAGGRVAPVRHLHPDVVAIFLEAADRRQVAKAAADRTGRWGIQIDLSDRGRRLIHVDRGNAGVRACAQMNGHLVAAKGEVGPGAEGAAAMNRAAAGARPAFQRPVGAQPFAIAGSVVETRWNPGAPFLMHLVGYVGMDVPDIDRNRRAVGRSIAVPHLVQPGQAQRRHLGNPVDHKTCIGVHRFDGCIGAVVGAGVGGRCGVILPDHVAFVADDPGRPRVVQSDGLQFTR